MKLRYYLRGLGIGIIVTALTMGIAAGDGQPLTDAEIKAAAYELGMVDSSSLKLTDIQPSSSPENVPESTLPPGSDEGEGESPTPTPTPKPTPTPTPTPKPTPTPTPTPTPESEQASSGESTGLVSVTVSPGSDSRTVSNQLQDAGLIEDAGEFDRYLMDNGYSRRICVGTYEISMGAEWEEIAKIITKTR